MPVSGKVLEDSIRLSRIRKIKLTLYAVQAGMLVALAFLMIFVFGRATIEPYVYIPLDAFIAVLVLLLLIIALESFFFRLLEIRFGRSSSARHLMAKNSIKRSLLMAALAGIAAIIITVPSIIGGIEDSTSETFYVNPKEHPPYFYSSDVFAFTRTVEVLVTTPKEIEVYLLTEDLFEQYYDGAESMAIMFTYRINIEDYLVVNNELSFEVPESQEYTRYYIVLNDAQNPGTGVMATLVKRASAMFTSVTSLMLISFVVANVAWAAYLIPIERKYSAGSIYR